MKITIVGLAGSGKTTLAKKISAKFDIPHVHLDRYWFEGGGRLNQPAEEKAIVNAYIWEHIRPIIVDAPSWVSDGWYSSQQPRITPLADTIVFLDIPLPVRLLGHAKRMVNRGSRHKELSIWQEVVFFYEMIRRTRLLRPKIMKFLELHQDKLLTFHSHKEAEAYLAQL